MRRLICLIQYAPPPVCGSGVPPIYVFYISSFVVEFSGDFVAYIRLPNIGMGDKTRSQQQEWARQVANFFRGRGSAEYWHVIFGTAAKTLGVCLTPPPPPDFWNPRLFLGFSAKTRSLPVVRANPGIQYQWARERMKRQVRGDGFTIRFERASKTRNGFPGFLWAPLELFAKLVIADCPPMWEQPWRRNYLKCRILRQIGELTPSDAPWSRRIQNAGNFARRF